MASKTKAGGIAGGVVGATALALTIVAPAEGYVPYVYKDAVGVLTYCYGETQNAKAQKGKRFTEAECRALLARRLPHYDQGNGACVANWETLPIEVRASFDSFSYNLGNATFCKSTAAKYLRAGQVKQACFEMGKFIKAGGKVLSGLVKRRAVEQTMCLKGVA